LAASFARSRAEVAAALLGDLKTVDAALAAKFETMNQKDPVAFANVAVAEADDSYYCGSQSRANFERIFPATYRVFADAGDPGSMVNLFGTR
jgi:hypothetical protein